MARCLGADPPYGCKHFKEHSRAAKKGWREHYHGIPEHQAISALYGEEVTQLHEHPEHAGKVRFKAEGKWYEIAKRDYNSDVAAGRTILRSEAKTSREEGKEHSRQERQQVTRRKEAFAQVIHQIRAGGGIKPYRKPGTGGKVPELEEWKSLPRAVKTTSSKGMTLDEWADEINHSYLGIHVETGNDLADYLRSEHNATHPLYRHI